MQTKMSSFARFLVLAIVCKISAFENSTEDTRAPNDYRITAEEEENTVNGSQIAEATANEPATPVPAVTLTACELTTQRRLTVIKSSSFPNPYNPNIDCKYVVKRQSENTCSVTFLFNVFDLQRSEDCEKDYVSIEGERICGSQPIGFTRTIQFSEPEESVVMTFHSDNATSGVGFMVTVVQQECPSPACDRNFNETRFEMKSPRFPTPYDNRQSCLYTIFKTTPNVCRLKLEVRSFDIEDGERCEADYLDVNGDRLCGILLEGQIVDVDFSSDILIARFHSDDVTTRDGFHFDVTQEECTDISPVTHQKTTEQLEPISLANDNVTSVENGADITTVVLKAD